MVNSCISSAFRSAGIPNKVEPNNFESEYGVRPDGVSLIPFRRGQCIAWDVSIPHPLCESHAPSNNKCGQLACKVEHQKDKKYEPLKDRFHFSPIIIDTIGAYGAKTTQTIKEIGNKIRRKTGNQMASAHLRQKISIAIQKGNHMDLMFAFSTVSI